MKPTGLTREVIDEDLQITRVTLATITADVRTLSTRAADAIQEAVDKLDLARREVAELVQK